MQNFAEWVLGNGITVLGQQISWAELVGQVCALAVVFLAQRRTLATWPVQVSATVLLFAVYASAHLGGLAIRQVMILLISVYGWWAWSRRTDPVYGVVVRKARVSERLALLAALLVGTAAFALLLTELDASWAPWPDAWIFVGTLVAFWAQGRGLVEFWLVWLAVDAVGVPLQIASGLWFSAAIYVVFAALVIHGWWSWNRTARRQRAQRPAAVKP
ncbi:nicotinamide mononucleotide transporter [Saccharopolyspora erythraea NRRL 2338]|uniref:Nicotinamide mononucleotide transporter n=2 Tax=Saccharopolyspora erythraea TaxID=1836 RepID=A4F9X7_SACEN|nr:nicotinamide mononucleotide transporter family protein [Saccharopolyspora erythraea]EQD83253.1 nicotinamide mononucleotide transporter [Saccharopolyspora erythraea D]PFG94639.1 nicotinamide mononucleotide transporter [Saccharopolyspora erythraea NRRL 2338]QRK91370.1 nicotinamide mononucleotide transporter [Saccharopolyspora erythraea]CAM00852.1 nicotinamide mononucleotide transporter [Saccharopolyspora erythraea NRRL 2338]